MSWFININNWGTTDDWGCWRWMNIFESQLIFLNVFFFKYILTVLFFKTSHNMDGSLKTIILKSLKNTKKMNEETHNRAIILLFLISVFLRFWDFFSNFIRRNREQLTHLEVEWLEMCFVFVRDRLNPASLRLWFCV